MKKIFLIVFCLFFTLTFSQTEKEMLDAGIKKSTVKKIFKNFDGDLTSAVERWANTGSGKLSKKFTESAEKLGLDKAYLQSKLKKARTVRMQMIAGGVTAAAAGIAEGMQKQHEIEAEHLEKQMEIVQNSNFTIPKSSPSKRTAVPVTPYQFQGAESMNNSGTNDYGFQQQTGSLQNNINGGVDIYEVDEYGFEEKTGSMTNNINGGVDINRVDQYGFDEKTGSMTNNLNGGVDINRVDQYGFDEKTGGFRKNLNGGYDEYIIDRYGHEEIIKIYTKNLNGGYDIYKVNSNGMNTLIGSVKKGPW